jgi:hypothetical protein
MKKLLFLSMAVCLAFSMSALAGDKGKEVKVSGVITDPMCAKSADKAMHSDAECAKKCSEKAGGKLAFVNSADGKVWMIENVEAVKGHEGHSVDINGHANAEAGTLHVMSVSMTDDKSNKNEKHKHGDDKKAEKKTS